jgi:hypothetical protein
VFRADAVGMSDTKLLTLNELAERTGLPAAWLKREADAARLPCIRAGRRRMFDPAAVMKALADRQESGVSRVE